MARSLKSQVIHAISTSFYGDQERGISGGFGTSKHSDKISNQKAGKIYSYDCYNNRQDVAKEFCSWMKNEHPEIRRASDLTERHATEFLAKKSSEVSTNTLTNIRSQLKGIASAINHTYQSADVSLDTPVMSGTTDRNVKTVSMVKSDYVKLVDSYKDAYSTGATGARVIYSSGLRASEVCTLKGSDITVKDRDVFKAFLSHCCIEFNILQDGYYRNLTKEMIKCDKELSLLLSQQAALCCLDVCNCIDPVFLRDEDFCLKLVDLSDDFFEVLPHEMKNNKKIQLHANRAKRIREERLREPFCCV